MFCQIVLLKETRALADRQFTYAIPQGLKLEIGQLVRVPFARQGNLPALVMAFHSNHPVGYIAKPVAGLISPAAFFTPEQLNQLHYIAKDTMTPFAQVVLAALPSSFLKLGPAQFAPPQTTVCRLLEEDYRKGGLASPWRDQCARLSSKLTTRQREVLDALIQLRDDTGEVEWPLRFLQAETQASKGVFQKLADAEAIELRHETAYRCPLNMYESQRKKISPLNDEQQGVYNQVLESLKHPFKKESHTFVLHGITGSGKTEVYMALADEVMSQGKTVLMLVPEIALTGALAERFMNRFGRDRMALWHSQLSMGEKLDTWQRIASGEIRLVIGARSALFTPIQELGLIIMDEFHDNSFKQDSPAPRYDARRVCRWMSETQQVPLLLGSATPELGAYHLAVDGENAQLLTLTKRHGNAKIPHVHVVDMKVERAQGHLSAMSRELQAALKETVSRGEQAIILLNRRGFHTFVNCGGCGHVFECPDCSVSLTYHKNAQVVKCHHCGHVAERPTFCPKCASINVQFVGSGTQKIEKELEDLLADVEWPLTEHHCHPERNVVKPKDLTTVENPTLGVTSLGDPLTTLRMTTKILRLDGDVMSRKGAFKEVLDDFKNGIAPVLVGTQMVAKGLDVANVTLVGVLGADSSFFMPDYLAHERGFQLLTQVAGRAGRGEKPGNVYLQSWQPDHPVLNMAVAQNFPSFYAVEIQERKQHKYPPFSQLMRLIVSGEDLERVRFFAKGIKKTLAESFEKQGFLPAQDFQLLGPSPCLIERIQAKWRYHILIKNYIGAPIHESVAEQLGALTVPDGLHCLIDTNAQAVM